MAWRIAWMIIGMLCVVAASAILWIKVAGGYVDWPVTIFFIMVELLLAFISFGLMYGEGL